MGAGDIVVDMTCAGWVTVRTHCAIGRAMLSAFWLICFDRIVSFECSHFSWSKVCIAEDGFFPVSCCTAFEQVIYGVDSKVVDVLYIV